MADVQLVTTVKLGPAQTAAVVVKEGDSIDVSHFAHS